MSCTPSKDRARKPRQRQAFAALVLLALVMRLLGVPVHLSQEQHCGPADHVSAHLERCLGHGHRGGEPAHEGEHSHGGTHSHDEGHPEHCALDHASELLAQRAPAPDVSVDFEASEPAPGGLRAPPGGACAARVDRWRPPRHALRGSAPPRGPPQRT